jgi:FixJ family two-component response regulator
MTFIQKPVTPDVLVRAVQRVLTESAKRPSSP